MVQPAGAGDSDVVVEGYRPLRGLRSFNRRFLGFRCAPPQALRYHPLRGLEGRPASTDDRTMMSKYEMVIYWSEPDGDFVVEVPELPGCMADGATYQEAVSNAERIIQEWIETAMEVGRPIPQPKGRLIYA